MNNLLGQSVLRRWGVVKPDYLVPLLTVVLISVVLYQVDDVWGSLIHLIYLLLVVACSVAWGLRSGLAAGVFSIIGHSTAMFMSMPLQLENNLIHFGLINASFLFTAFLTGALAKENHALLIDTMMRNRQVEAINAIVGEIAAISDEENMLQHAANRILETFGFYHIAIGKFEIGKGEPAIILEACACAVNEFCVPSGERYSLEGGGIMAWVIQNAEPVLIEDVTKDRRFLPCDALPGTRSEAAVPIFARGEVWGVLDAQSNRESNLCESDVHALQILAGHLAIALENIRLMAAERNRRREAVTLQEVTSALTSTLDLDEILASILVLLEDVLSYDSAAIILRQGERLNVLAARGHPSVEELMKEDFPADDALFQEIKQSSNPLILTDAQSDSRFQRWGQTEYVRGWMGLPLIVREKVIGFLTVDSIEVGAFSQDEATVVQSFANQAAHAIANARLYVRAQTTRDYYRTILDGLHDEILIIDQDYFITDVNGPFLRKTGYHREEVVGKHCYEISHHSAVPCWQMKPPEHPCPAVEVWQTSRSARAVHLHYDVDGKAAWMDLAASPLVDGKGNVSAIVEAGREVTSEKRLQAQLEAIYDLGQELTLLLDEAAIAQRVIGTAIELLAFDLVSLGLIEGDTNELIYRYTTDPEKMGLSFPLDEKSDIGVAVICEGETKVLTDAGETSEGGQGFTVRERFQICAPLKAGDRIIGVLSGATTGQGSISQDDQYLFKTLADQAAIALESARLYEDVQALSLSAIRSLATAIDARDPYTRGHSEGVTRLTVRMASELGWCGTDLEMLEYAALLHDVGKIAVPDAILRKKTKLTKKEWGEIHMHPIQSAKIVSPIKSLQKIIPWIYHHQERWDGSGYPDGLAGEAIPLAARIIAIADAYDAMTTDRPYRKTLTEEEALVEVERCAGTQFDPKVVEVFLKVVGET